MPEVDNFGPTPETLMVTNTLMFIGAASAGAITITAFVLLGFGNWQEAAAVTKHWCGHLATPPDMPVRHSADVQAPLRSGREPAMR